MTTAVLAVLFGLVLLVWSADRFIEGAAAVARRFGMPPLLIGMIIVGFGTSAPEILVSATAAMQSNPGIALGNAYGSNIANIALILGIAALISPISVHSRIIRSELPILTGATALSAVILLGGMVTRYEALLLIASFAALVAWTIRQGTATHETALEGEITRELDGRTMPVSRALIALTVGLTLLILSSRLLVWGAVKIARGFGVGDLVIGLTIVALGTSLPELASSVIAARKGEHDIALGNILGSNLFNTLAVVGIAGVIRPLPVVPQALSRDFPVMAGLTVSLFVIGYGFRGPGRINRVEGGILVAVYLGYTVMLAAPLLRIPV